MKRAAFIWFMLGWCMGQGAQPLHAEFVSSFQDVSTVRAYPNPWKISQHSALPMTFDQLPSETVSTVKIYTLSGEWVRTLTGAQNLRWDLRNSGGQNVASGIYLYLLTADNRRKTGKIIVIR